jgi:hypothetical protein
MTLRPLAALALLAAGAARGEGEPPAARAGETRSLAVYPEQEMALRFGHARHLRLEGVGCSTCHERIAGSESASDRNLPAQARCEACHRIEAARAGEKVSPPSACQDCHPGFDWTVHPAPRPSRLPAPNLHFSHRAHLARGAGCADCHGAMEEVERASRAQLPGMASCLRCHDGRKASADCATCHPTSLRARGAPIETRFPSGELKPGPGDPFGLDHGPRFERFHALLGAGQRQRCMACHAEPWCQRCHDGALRPQSIHPGDFLSTHMVPARQEAERCDACHRRQTFCVACHERTGVGRNAGAPFYDPGLAQVHPPGWMAAGPAFHGVEAARNIGNCASCHREEQCVQCHSTTTLGARVHPPGFPGRCREMRRKNDRACQKCHDLSSAGDPAARCR